MVFGGARYHAGMSARYEQVAAELRAAIQAGDYPPGAMLPSQPELARAHGLNQTSINRALGVLKAEGRIATRRGVGAFVVDVPPEALTPTERARRIDAIEREVKEMQDRLTLLATELRSLR